MAPSTLAGYLLEGALCCCGLLLLWRLVLRPEARGAPPPRYLAAWPGPLSDLLLYLVLAILGALLLLGPAGLLLTHTALASDARQVWATLAFDSGQIGGVALFWKTRTRLPAAPPSPDGSLRSGAATFLLVLPLVFIIGVAWQLLLSGVGFEPQRQDPVALFESLHNPATRVLFVFVAVIAAPIAEELVFRAGIFRFLRGRLPRGWAIFISALLFGGMHLLESPADGLGSLAQLVLLGAVFAVAYERTGRIGTSIVAHALFNLNTLVALLCGVNS